MVLRNGLAAVLGLLALGALMGSWSDFQTWLEIRFSEGYYVESDYLGQCLMVAIPAGLSLLACLLVLIRRKAGSGWLVVPFLLMLLLAVSLPGFKRFPSSEARSAVHHRARSLESELHRWSGEAGRFPTTEAEFQAMLKEEAKHGDWEASQPSRYARAGKRLEYQLVFVGGAAGPHQPTPPGDRPAVIYCAVSADGQRAWLTATGLDQPVNGSVVLLEFEPGLLWLEVKLPDTQPK